MANHISYRCLEIAEAAAAAAAASTERIETADISKMMPVASDDNDAKRDTRARVLAG